MKKKAHSANMVLLGCTLICAISHGLLGGTAGLYFPSMAVDMQLSYTQISATLMLTVLTMMLFLPVGAILIDRMDVRLLALACVIFDAISLFLRSISTGMTLLCISSAMMGIGDSMITGMLGTVLVTAWFQKKLGIALGIMSAVGGFSGAVFNPIISYLILNLGWRASIRFTMLFMLLVLVPVSIFTLRRRPDVDETSDTSEDEAGTEKQGLSFREVLRKPAFFLFLLAAVCLVMPLAIQAHLATHTMTRGYALDNGATVVSALLIGNGIGRLSLGFMLDRYRPNRILFLFMIFGAAGFFGLAFSSSLVLLVSSSVLAGLFFSIMNVATPYIASDMFGKRANPQIMAVIGVISMLTSASTGMLIGQSFDRNSNYTAVLYIFASSVLVGSIVMIWTYLMNKKQAA